MPDQMQQRVGPGRNLLGDGIEGGWAYGPIQLDRRGVGGQHVAGDIAECVAHTGYRGGDVERRQAVPIESRRTGRDDQGAQIAPPDRRIAAIGDGGQVEREGNILVKCQQVPPAVERCAEALPTQDAQSLVLDCQQDAQPVVVGGFGSCSGKRVAHLVAEDRLAEDRAVRLRIDGGGQQRALRLAAERQDTLRTQPQRAARACPLDDDRPGFLRLALDGDLEGAHRLPRAASQGDQCEVAAIGLILRPRVIAAVPEAGIATSEQWRRVDRAASIINILSRRL
jgi:hypothetical protein